MCKTYLKEGLKHEPKMENRNENQENATRKVREIDVRRLQKYKKMKTGGALGTIFSTFARCSNEFLKKSSKTGAKMRKVAPKMGQDGNKMAQDGPRWQQDGHLGPNLGGLGPILASA